MAKLNLPIQSFEIKYETAPEIPPPYCYYYYVRGKVEKNNLSIEIEWVYHHREDLTADEITDEGFTGNDNFSWRGNIGILWLEELEKQIAQTQVTNKISEEAPFMHIVIQSRNGNMLNGYPVNVDDWDYFMQEFIQGIYEASGKEAPLEIRFIKNNPDQTFYKVIMTLFFQSRTIQIQSITSLSKNSQTIQNWEQTKSILKDIYATRYLPEYALDHEPTKPGTFIDNGDGVWFEFYKGVINAQKRSNTLDKLEKFFISFSH